MLRSNMCSRSASKWLDSLHINIEGSSLRRPLCCAWTNQKVVKSRQKLPSSWQRLPQRARYKRLKDSRTTPTTTDQEGNSNKSCLQKEAGMKQGKSLLCVWAIMCYHKKVIYRLLVVPRRPKTQQAYDRTIQRPWEPAGSRRLPTAAPPGGLRPSRSSSTLHAPPPTLVSPAPLLQARERPATTDDQAAQRPAARGQRADQRWLGPPAEASSGRGPGRGQERSAGASRPVTGGSQCRGGPVSCEVTAASRGQAQPPWPADHGATQCGQLAMTVRPRG